MELLQIYRKRTNRSFGLISLEKNFGLIAFGRFSINSTSSSTTKFKSCINVLLFIFSGVLYYVGSTVNPILYNVMSRRFRRAFMETICHIRNQPSRGQQRTQYSQQSKGMEANMPLVERHIHNNKKPYTTNGNTLPLRTDRRMKPRTYNQTESNGVQNMNGSFQSAVIKPTFSNPENKYFSSVDTKDLSVANKYLMESRFVSSIAKQNQNERLGVHVWVLQGIQINSITLLTLKRQTDGPGSEVIKLFVCWT